MVRMSFNAAALVFDEVGMRWLPQNTDVIKLGARRWTLHTLLLHCGRPYASLAQGAQHRHAWQSASWGLKGERSTPGFFQRAEREGPDWAELLAMVMQTHSVITLIYLMLWNLDRVLELAPL
jgi:hypothetical protein